MKSDEITKTEQVEDNQFDLFKRLQSFDYGLFMYLIEKRVGTLELELKKGLDHTERLEIYRAQKELVKLGTETFKKQFEDAEYAMRYQNEEL